jgi:hypothetical protein
MAKSTRKVAAVKPLKRSLAAARASKQDEFYTQYVDIQKEVEAYLEFDPDTFRGKVVYCNCDDPFESNFFKYFAANFNKLDLKKLVSTSYDGSPIAGQGTLFPEYNEDETWGRNVGTDGTYPGFLKLGHRGEAELSYIRPRFLRPTAFAWD